MGFGKRKSEKLALTLPAVYQPDLPVPPSVRIMEIANMRSWAYGLLVANLISVLCAFGFYFLMLSRIEEIAYVADGSSYGCSPATQEIAPVEAAPPLRNPSTMPVLEPLAPFEG